MMSLSFQPAAVTGISIQPQNIHLVQLKKAKNGYALERACRNSLPADIFSEGKIAAFELLQTCLGELVRGEELRHSRAVVCVTANQVKFQRINLPAGLSDLDIEAEISTQVYRALPGKSDALAIDFQIEPAAEAETVKVFYAAARKEYIQRYQSCVDAAGLRVAMVDIDIFALLRGVRYALRDVCVDHQSLCALYLGEDYAVIVAEREHEILFHQQWDGVGGSRLAMTCLQWVEWCVHTYQKIDITCLAIAGKQASIYPAVKMIAAKWKCKIYEPDPFLQMTNGSMIHQAMMHDCPSSYLVACGLAMRELSKW